MPIASSVKIWENHILNVILHGDHFVVYDSLFNLIISMNVSRHQRYVNYNCETLSGLDELVR